MNNAWSELTAGFVPGFTQGLIGLAVSLLILTLAPEGNGMSQTLLVIGAIAIGGAVTVLLQLLMGSLL